MQGTQVGLGAFLAFPTYAETAIASGLLSWLKPSRGWCLEREVEAVVPEKDGKREQVML